MGYVRSTAVHRCPCGCGSNIPNHLYACRPGWYRLPAEIRSAIWGTVKLTLLHPDRRAALSAAAEWYRDNQPGVSGQS